ncbi:wnt inhibitory factor 1-like [Diaphorina citri]|uniref:Wnt inhibitory factor 1-like n=1 Tax=Diaphorina citri TaxID=121845 RepID=A0A1S3DNK8_DIACI|nr:wnt inhibitory factor 1-like [Diaphorina citri]
MVSFPGPGPGCDQKCSNGGWCDSQQMCQCPKGYQGTYCGTAMCFPQCLNNGTCTAPGVCSCPPGFQGLHCEGGPGCDQKCSNGGWCDSQQMCQCPKGYQGTYCGTAMCFPQCLNNGTCTAPGVCSCPPGFQGLHCEGGKRGGDFSFSGCAKNTKFFNWRISELFLLNLFLFLLYLG